MRKNGFTLIELLFTLAVTSILLLCSIACWSDFKQKNEKDMLIKEITNTIRYAKMRALNEGSTMVLSPNGSEKDWSTGISLLTMHSKQPIYQWEMKSTHWTLQWFGVNGSHKIILSGTTHAMSNGRFILTNQQNQEKVILILNKLGRIKQT